MLAYVKGMDMRCPLRMCKKPDMDKHEHKGVVTYTCKYCLTKVTVPKETLKKEG